MGYEPVKKVKGRNIDSLVDTLGLPIRLVVHSAGVQDRDGASLPFDEIKLRFPWLECVFADTGYNAQQNYEAAGANGLRLEVVRCNPNAVGFEVIKFLEVVTGWDTSGLLRDTPVQFRWGLSRPHTLS